MSTTTTVVPDEPDPARPVLVGVLASTGRPVYAIVDPAKPTPPNGAGPARVDRALLERLIARHHHAAGTRRP